MVKGERNNVVELLSPGRESTAQLLERLFREYGGEVVNFIRQRAEQIAEQPEDIAQEVFLRLAKREQLLEEMRLGQVNCRPYLFSMANNFLVDLERRKARVRKYEESAYGQLDPHESVDGETPEALAIVDSEVAAFKHVIADLQPAWRQAFLLNRFKYMSYQEIARHMGVTVKQVEHYITRVLIRLRDVQEQLDKQGELS